MATVAQSKLKGQNAPPVIPLAMGWNLVVIAGSVLLGMRLLSGDQLRDLGDPVQYFLAAITFIPGLLAVYSTLELFQGRPNGRYAAMGLYYIGMVLTGLYTLHLWGVFTGIDGIGQALYDNAALLIGFAMAYGFYMVAGWLPESNPARAYIEMAAIGVAMLTLLLLLFFGGAIEAVFDILSTYSEVRVWLTTIVFIIFGVLGYLMLQLGEYFGETPDQRVAWQGLLMVSPNIIGFFLFFAGPLLLSFYLSFTNSTGVTVPEFIDVKNYGDILALQFKMQDNLADNPQRVLSFGFITLDTLNIGDQRLVIGAKDVLFWQSLRNTIVFCLMLVPLSTIPALLLAVIMNSKIPGMKFFRALYFLPSVAAVVGTALIWRWLYNANIGYINYAISEFVGGINSVFGGSIEDPAIEWLTDQNVMLFSIVLLAAWQLIGFNTVLFLAGLQGIPTTLYEASFVDGANRGQQFWYVTLPMLAPTTFFVIVTTIITGLQVFNEPYALIPSDPLPPAATTSVYYLYTRGFFRFEFGYASAVAWLLFALIFMITLIQFRTQRSAAYED